MIRSRLRFLQSVQVQTYKYVNCMETCKTWVQVRTDIRCLYLSSPSSVCPSCLHSPTGRRSGPWSLSAPSLWQEAPPSSLQRDREGGQGGRHGKPCKDLGSSACCSRNLNLKSVVGWTSVISHIPGIKKAAAHCDWFVLRQGNKELMIF